MKKVICGLALCLVVCLLMGMTAVSAASEDNPYSDQLQALLASSVEDYAAERVLKLGGSNRTNFAVVRESVLYIQQQLGVNTVLSADRETGCYEIGNADNRLAGLQPGMIVVYPYGEQGLMIGQAVSVVPENDTLTVVLEPVAPEAAFSHLKLELSGDTDSAVMSTRGALPGVSIRQENWETGEYGLRATAPASRIELLLEEVRCPESSRTVTGAVGLETETALNWYLAEQEQRLEWTVKTGVSMDLEVSGSGAQLLEIPLGELAFSFGRALGTAELKPVLQVQAPEDGQLVLNRLEYTFGFCWESSGEAVSLTPVAEWSCEPVYPEGTEPVLAGAKLTMEAKLRDGLLLDACVDGAISNSLAEEVTQLEPGREHMCVACFDGEIAVDARLGADAALLNRNVIESATLWEEHRKIGDFYVCPEHGGLFMGTCPDFRDRMPGDIDGNGKQNNKDVLRLMQYLAGWDVEVEAGSLDINGDGKLNNKDPLCLMQYLAGWDVKIH